MSNEISRRSMIRKSFLLAGGVGMAPGFMSQLSANTINSCQADRQVLADWQATGGDPKELKARLFANENPFGPSANAKQAIDGALPQAYQYPFMFMRDIYQRISESYGLSPDQLLLAAGSTPLLLATALVSSQKPGSNVISGDPSYEDLPSRAVAVNAKWVKVPLTSEYKLDLDAMEKAIDANTSLVYICNPNNPTGTVLDPAKLKAFCERVSAKVPVFIDEAYIDYLPDPAGNTMMGLVKDGRNVIVSRTFSKLHGFAGLRVGYIFAQPDMVKKLELYTEGPMSISTTSLHAAYISFQDKEFLKGALEKTMASKNYLYDVLKKEGYDYIPSSTNFVLFPVKMDSRQFVEEMGKRGVGVRFWQFNSKEWCRVSIGRMDEMQAFAAAFKEIS